jgi:hypothetical protein
MTSGGRFTIRELPLAARLTLAAFLIAVGLGYGSALVQLHFQHASPGRALPSINDVVRKFHGDPHGGPPVSMLERLIATPGHDHVPFTGSGSMAKAFTVRSSDFSREIRKRDRIDVEREREGERQVLLAWVRDGLKRDIFEADSMSRPAQLAEHPITPDFVNADGTIKIKALFTERCVRCHQADGDDAAATKYPLNTFEQIQQYAKIETSAGIMSLPALTQSTHTHLLSFAMLWAATGLIIAFSSYPGWVRIWLAPIVLIAQVADIACWWLARLDGDIGVMFAKSIVVTGGIVGVGVALQIVLGLFNLFGAAGRVVLIFLMLAGGYGGYVLNERVLKPQLATEQAAKAEAKVE